MIFIDEADKSINYLDKSIKMNSNSNNYNSRAFAYYKLKKYENAKNDALEAMKLNVEDSESYYNLALIYIEQRKFKEACDMKKKAEEFGSEKVVNLIIENCEL